MTTTIAIFTTLVVLLGAVGPASAQQGRETVIDVLTDVLGLNRTVRGHVVQHREATLILRGEDQRTYAINTAGLDTRALGRLKEGQPVTVTLKSGSDAGMPIAASVERREGGAKVFRRVEGTVESVSGDRVTFRTRDGMTLTLDRSRIVGPLPRVSANETAMLVYEEEPQVAGVWIDARGVQPSAAVPWGAYERVHGYVRAVGVGTLTLKADDGRTLTVDTTQVAEPPRVRPGDVVSVVGKAVGDRRDRFVAEVIQPDAAGAASPR